ncbi:endoplasmic reticulum resident protein 44 isoform X2 [Symphalangus syndactylus]
MRLVQDYISRSAPRWAGPGSEGVRGLSGSCPGCSPLEPPSRGRGAAAWRILRCRRLPEPSPFLTQPNQAQSQPPAPVPAADPSVTMHPAVFLSLPDLRCSLLLLVTWVFTPVTTEITSLDTENIDEILNNADVALVNFYADWCRFSQMLHPIFEEASDVIKEEFPNENQVVFARVDCDQHSDIAQRYRISKYPTLKLFRNGMMMKREYRGQRSVKALADYIRQQKSDPIQEIRDLAEITTLDRSKRNIIGYFEQKDSDNYRVFERVANILHDDCAFLSAFGDVSKPERYSGDNIIYKPPGSAPDMVYLGAMTNFDVTYNWIQDKCVPLVREITFENGEELTEEGLPFLILFHMKEDTESLEIFQNEVARQLISEKGTINFLHADCDKFRHPLLHIQKTPADCPVIAIDSFRHMYVFGDFKDVLIPGKLKQFVFDLHSGKLHREFHHGPDPTDTAPGEQAQDVASSPPESSFQKLAPSEYRYTLLRDRDEL